MYDPKFELGRYFCTMHLPSKFHHLMFIRLEVVDKQTDAAESLKTSNALRYAIRPGTLHTASKQYVKPWLHVK